MRRKENYKKKRKGRFEQRRGKRGISHSDTKRFALAGDESLPTDEPLPFLHGAGRHTRSLIGNQDDLIFGPSIAHSQQEI